MPEYQIYSPGLPATPEAIVENRELQHETPEFSAFNPTLNSLLEDICERNSVAIEPISSHICALQEMFLDTVYIKLEQAQIDFTEKITIYLNRKNELKVLGEHPEKDRVEAVLAETPGLAEVFSTLSSHSEIARDIVNINRIFSSLVAGGEYAGENASGYHLSLKGGMSHFYFV